MQEKALSINAIGKTTLRVDAKRPLLRKKLVCAITTDDVAADLEADLVGKAGDGWPGTGAN